MGTCYFITGFIGRMQVDTGGQLLKKMHFYFKTAFRLHGRLLLFIIE